MAIPSIVHLVPYYSYLMVMVSNNLDSLMDHLGHLCLQLNLSHDLFCRCRDRSHHTPLLLSEIMCRYVETFAIMHPLVRYTDPFFVFSRFSLLPKRTKIETF